MQFAMDVAENFAVVEPVVEIGSRAAPGQETVANIRGLFGAVEYIGCDMQEGHGVDRIEDVRSLTFADDSVGTIMCLETLEHVSDPIRAVQEMHRVLRPGGLLAISSVMFFPIHEHPHDYWRFTPEAFELLLEPFSSRFVMAHGYDLLPEGVYGIGIKGSVEQLGPERFPRLVHFAQHWADGRPVEFGPIRLSTRKLLEVTAQESVAALRRRAGAVRRRISR